ncbi:hypothetical protein PR048_029943 [Dryococelus australis]|uniref:MADF domain-containing protein n=1 Tax=Dryococelus australis TaxID=614101 RepID=A0ABQ9G8E6_9NEOP|nr:hypothetical protein PR048_029943 [Dryococelus australis]
MIKLGYHVSASLKEGGVKCAQKWRNLERSYIQYVGHIKTAGVEKRKKNRMPPLNYEELHAILKGRNFTNYDETAMLSGTTNEYEHSDIDMPEDLPTSFSSRRNIKSSEATPQDVLNFVVNEAKKQEKQFSKLCEILNRQNDEKKRLTDAIIAYLGQPVKPRKRKASDTDSD